MNKYKKAYTVLVNRIKGIKSGESAALGELTHEQLCVLYGLEGCIQAIEECILKEE